MELMKNTVTKARIFFTDIKFEHSLFALPFAYLGLFMAERRMPGFPIFFWITLAMVSFRTMAMSLNRILDIAVDAKNPRTQDRALPSGKLKKELIWGIVALSLAVFEYSAYRLGRLCFLLTPVPVLMAWIYPLVKKVSWLSHFVLGSVLAIAPYGAWIASRGSFNVVPTLISAGVVFWVAGFDMIYALQDLDFDRFQGLHSFPAKFGQDLTLAMTKALHLLSVICWAAAGYLNGNKTIFFIGVLAAALFLNRSYHLVRSAGIAKINEAFFTMNVLVSVLLFVAVFLDMI